MEFGGKVHKFQEDGISFIEHLSFDAFHEGKGLQATIITVLTHTKVRLLRADAIYAANENRKMITKAKISTDFNPKG